ncbi:hypothetical protein [uncultured Sutterella sp.]|uniref:hypothetical protein n=1 Tax=uncultured Sutterella sp. TaxID=286133 RepID=UPI00259BE82B|nr:hypothetical protein [uncultured Sutterella sp.]
MANYQIKGTSGEEAALLPGYFICPTAMITITEDSLRLSVREYQEAEKARTQAFTKCTTLGTFGFSMLLTFLSSSEFKSFLWLTGEQWSGIVLCCALASIVGACWQFWEFRKIPPAEDLVGGLLKKSRETKSHMAKPESPTYKAGQYLPEGWVKSPKMPEDRS